MYIVKSDNRLGFQLLVHEGDTRNTHCGRIRLKPGEHLMLHKHDWEQVFFVVQADKMLIQVGEDEEIISEPCAIWIPPGWEHTVYNAGKKPLVYFYTSIWKSPAECKAYHTKKSKKQYEQWSKENPRLHAEMQRFRKATASMKKIPKPHKIARNPDTFGDGLLATYEAAKQSPKKSKAPAKSRKP